MIVRIIHESSSHDAFSRALLYDSTNMSPNVSNVISVWVGGADEGCGFPKQPSRISVLIRSAIASASLFDST
jgi:hypothetical protein